VNGGKEVIDAFQKVYGIDIKKNGGITSSHLKVEKIK